MVGGEGDGPEEETDVEGDLSKPMIFCIFAVQVLDAELSAKSTATPLHR